VVVVEQVVQGSGLHGLMLLVDLGKNQGGHAHHGLQGGTLGLGLVGLLGEWRPAWKRQ